MIQRVVGNRLGIDPSGVKVLNSSFGEREAIRDGAGNLRATVSVPGGRTLDLFGAYGGTQETAVGPVVKLGEGSIPAP